MHIEKLTCSNCGSTHLDQIAPGEYQCPYCDATYLIDYDSNTGQLGDAKVMGDHQRTQVYAVHGKLTVTGEHNRIRLMTNAKEAQHIGDLEVCGNHNRVPVVLLDGATYDLNGERNRVRSGERRELREERRQARRQRRSERWGDSADGTIE